MNKILTPLMMLLQIAIVALLAALAWSQLRGGAPLPSDGATVGVLLSNGAAYYGAPKGNGGDYLVLTNVHQIQQTRGADGKTTNRLVKRGQQVHGPTEMIIPRSSIVMIEPVSPQSQVGKALAN
jgi:hypothetical protein